MLNGRTVDAFKAAPQLVLWSLAVCCSVVLVRMGDEVRQLNCADRGRMGC